MTDASRFIDATDPLSPPAGLEGAVVAIGNFDGLHRGHRGVIARARALAARLGKPCAVLTFEPHPADFFARKSVIFRLTSHEAKAAFLARLGLDGMIVLTFDAALSGLTAQQFVDDVLVRRLGVSGVVAGYDFHFGAKRQGTPEFLKAEGARQGFAVDIVERISQDEEGSLDAVSSTATRAALEAGDVALAARLLGHPWFVEGVVIHGAKRGRTIGFPTPPGIHRASRVSSLPSPPFPEETLHVDVFRPFPPDQRPAGRHDPFGGPLRRPAVGGLGTRRHAAARRRSARRTGATGGR